MGLFKDVYFTKEGSKQNPLYKAGEKISVYENEAIQLIELGFATETEPATEPEEVKTKQEKSKK